MARYTVHVKIKHDHLGDGPSDLVVTMRGDKKILQDVENYALHYEEMSKSLATVEADLELCKKWLRDCHESKAKIGDRCLALESERDELRRRCESYKSAYDAILADLQIMEQKLNDLQVENSRLIRIGEERHIRAKDTEEGLMEHVERLQAKNKSLLDAIKIIHGLSMNDRILKDVEIRNVCRQALEVDGGKD